MSAPDFDGVPMSSREVEIARSAYRLGFVERDHGHQPQPETWYPLPNVTRPRIVKDPEWPGHEWRFVDGGLQLRATKPFAPADEGWMRWMDFRVLSESAPLPKRVAMWAELIANPNENGGA